MTILNRASARVYNLKYLKAIPTSSNSKRGQSFFFPPPSRKDKRRADKLLFLRVLSFVDGDTENSVRGDRYAQLSMRARASLFVLDYYGLDVHFKY